jgi:hypothetical protein
MQNNWPAPNLAGEMFEALHAGLEVRLIATPREALQTCRPDQLVSDVVRSNVEPYDYIPVVEGTPGQSELIIGLFHAANYKQNVLTEERIRDNFHSLSEDFIIGGDSSILEFIKGADTRPCRLLVSGANIVGLVSLSDLQKLPVRAVLFALITGFEIAMMDAIRRIYETESDWLAMLRPERRTKIEREKKSAKEMDVFVDTLLFTLFSDKATLIKRYGLGRGVDPSLEKSLGTIKELRNKIAHANEYARTPEEARKVCATVRDLLRLRLEISRL